ncbi:TIGR01841 family phasin [Undibacterium sp. Di26W]|uniref:phasin family protein n=1 Tax=Undibacterium sp. Di26W TaxID=3413035 RepID=UPI003BF17040
MSLLTEQLSSAAQNQFATQIAVFRAFSQSAFGGLEKLIALNFNLAKQSFDNANTVTHEFFAVKAPQDILTLSHTHSQPQLEKILAYGRELASITSNARAELWQAVSSSEQGVTAVTVPAIKTAAKKPAVAKPIAATTQLTLLAEPEAKPVTKLKAKAKPAAKVEVKADVKKAGAEKIAKTSKSAATKPIVAKPADATKKASPAKASKPVTAAPKAQPAAAEKTIEKTTAKKPLKKATTPINASNAGNAANHTDSAATTTSPAATKPAPKKTATKPAASVESAPAPVEATTPEKKSAVKFPFPIAPRLKAGTPAFPGAAAPAYKAKSSSATGAKKRVRQ